MIYLYNKTTSEIITSDIYEYVDKDEYESKYTEFKDDIDNGYKIILYDNSTHGLYIKDIPAYAVITDSYGNLYLADNVPVSTDNVVDVIKLNKKDKAKMMADISEGYVYWRENDKFNKIKIGNNERYDAATHKAVVIDTTADDIRDIKHRILSTDYRNTIATRGVQFTHKDKIYYIAFNRYTETSIRLLSILALQDVDRMLMVQYRNKEGLMIPAVIDNISFDLVNSIIGKLNAFDIYLDVAIKEFNQSVTDDNDLASLQNKEAHAIDIIYTMVLNKYANKDMVEKEG